MAPTWTLTTTMVCPPLILRSSNSLSTFLGVTPKNNPAMFFALQKSKFWSADHRIFFSKRQTFPHNISLWQLLFETTSDKPIPLQLSHSLSARKYNAPWLSLLSLAFFGHFWFAHSWCRSVEPMRSALIFVLVVLRATSLSSTFP